MKSFDSIKIAFSEDNNNDMSQTNSPRKNSYYSRGSVEFEEFQNKLESIEKNMKTSNNTEQVINLPQSILENMLNAIITKENSTNLNQKIVKEIILNRRDVIFFNYELISGIDDEKNENFSEESEEVYKFSLINN